VGGLQGACLPTQLISCLDSSTKRDAVELVVKDFEWSLIAQAFAQSIIQPILDHRKLSVGDLREGTAFWDELAHQTIEVLVGSALPTRVGIGEVDN
jgi:hypothetical protein